VIPVLPFLGFADDREIQFALHYSRKKEKGRASSTAFHWVGTLGGEEISVIFQVLPDLGFL